MTSTSETSARAARTQFENGFGDALITYEQEAVSDLARGRLAAEIIYPRSTILSEHTVVSINRNIEAAERDLVLPPRPQRLVALS